MSLVLSQEFCLNRRSQECFFLFLFLLSILLGFTLGTLGFRYAPNLPVFSNPFEIDSPLVRQNFNPLNNSIRFIFLLICPAGFWLLFYKTIPSFQLPRAPENGKTFLPKDLLWQLSANLSLLVGVSYLAQATIFQAFKLDGYYFFHEGEWLGPAWKWTEHHQIWTGSFFAHGAFYDVLSSALSWKIFGIVSIGASRIFTLFLEKIIFLCVFGMLTAICKLTFSKEKLHNAALALLVMGSYFILSYQDWHNFERRDMLVLIGFPIFLHGLIRKNNFTLTMAGIFASASWIYSIDRGAYFTASIFFTIFALVLLSRDKKSFLREICFSLLGFFFGFFCFFFLFGREEMLAAFRASSYLLQIKDLSDGSPYPAPGFPIINLKFLLTRHTVPLVNFSIQMLSFFILCHKEKFKIKRDPIWITELALLVISLLYYRGALSRCDEVHYRYVASFGFIGAAFCLSKAIMNSHIWTKDWCKILLLVLCSLAPLKQLITNVSVLNPSFFQTYKSFAAKPDQEFLFDWQVSTLAYLNKEFKDEPCIYSMVSEPLWPYLMRKSNCGRFHLMWLISDKRLQLEAINEFNSYIPKKILMHTPRSGDEMDGILIEDRVKYLYQFIHERYEPSSSHNGWEVWALKARKKP